jgi:predicted transposase YbfD/YdcC
MMTETTKISLTDHLTEVEDPRIDRTKRHQLLDIIVIAVCAVVCGADDWMAIERFGQAKLDWFKSFLELPNGIPPHDTFGRVFAQLNPEQFQHGFLSWGQAMAKIKLGEIVALDSKTLRHSYDWQADKGAIHMVSAWASASRLVLGQLKVAEKSNEITAIPALLKLLPLKGCIVTIDALGCQTEIVELMVEQEADYVISLKGNQGTLPQEVQDLFAYAQEINYHQVAHAVHQTVEGNHGRIEIRRYTTIFEPEFITFANRNNKWTGLRTLGMVETERRWAEQVTHETRYYISSSGGNAIEFAQAVRTHWEIENSLH